MNDFEQKFQLWLDTKLTLVSIELELMAALAMEKLDLYTDADIIDVTNDLADRLTALNKATDGQALIDNPDIAQSIMNMTKLSGYPENDSSIALNFSVKFTVDEFFRDNPL